jgi:hypothetical protein
VAGALIRNRHANLVGIENPSLGAGDTDLVVPVPDTASRVSGLGVVETGEDTGTILQVVSLEASKASSRIIVRSALVRNGDTDLVGVEDPSFRA